MTPNDIKSRVGEHIYEQARNEARQSAAGTGSLESWQKRSEMTAFDTIMSEVGFDACEGDTDTEFVSFFTDLYREIPAYGLLHRMFISRAYADLDSEARRLFWQFTREMLSAPDDTLADPVAYYMWCQFFEDEWSGEAWKALTVGAPDRLLERILIVSGPVPFSIKRDLYAQKLGNRRWHYFLYRGLLGSTFDVYGRVEKNEARRMLERLKLSLPKREEEDLKQLRAQLAADH